MSQVAAIDVGGTFIKAALVNKNLDVIKTESAPTPKNDLTGINTVAEIKNLVTGFGNVDAIGLAVPGTLDEKKGIARWAGNLNWRDLPIVDLLKKSIDLPVAFSHDVRAGAVAELRAGAAKNYANSIFIPIGTGIAAALIIDGEIRSADGFAGEIGHLNVGGNTPCVCGKVGCLETEASAAAISKKYGGGKSAEEVLNLARSGDQKAKVIVDDSVEFIARGCEVLATVLGPEAIIFGGGLAQSSDLLIDPLKVNLDHKLTFQRKMELKTAKFGVLAGTIGCSMLAFDLVNS